MRCLCATIQTNFRPPTYIGREWEAICGDLDERQGSRLTSEICEVDQVETVKRGAVNRSLGLSGPLFTRLSNFRSNKRTWK